jgi:hypothetical protein
MTRLPNSVTVERFDIQPARKLRSPDQRRARELTDPVAKAQEPMPGFSPT